MVTEESETMEEDRLTLIGMPAVVKNMILERSDFQTILILRKVCHHFRDFIDQGKSLNLRNIYIDMFSKDIYFTLTSTSLKFIQIHFIRKSKQYEVKCGSQMRIIEEEDLLKVFQNELTFFLKHQKAILNILTIETDHPVNDYRAELIFDVLENCFQSMNRPFQVEKIRLRGNGNFLKQLLPYCDGEKFRKIEFWNKRFCHDFVITDELMTSSQWNNAREFFSEENILVGPIQSILHFVKMDVFIENLSVKDVILLRDSLLQSPNFESFKFHKRSKTSDGEKWISEVESFQLGVFVKALGKPSTPFIEDKKQEWYIRIPNSDKYLLISLIASDASFTRVPLSSVPKYVLQ